MSRTSGRLHVSSRSTASTPSPISLINAYVNGEHEQRIAKIVAEEHPDAFVCTSHEILPEMFEYERTNTTINAALVPVVREYLTDLSTKLDARGYQGDVLAMHSGGGVMTTDAIGYYAPRIANSGPTAGAIASQYIADHVRARTTRSQQPRYSVPASRCTRSKDQNAKHHC